MTEGTSADNLVPESEKFQEAIDKLLNYCDVVASFDDESGDDEKASLEYKDKVIGENNATRYKGPDHSSAGLVPDF